MNENEYLCESVQNFIVFSLIGLLLIAFYFVHVSRLISMLRVGN